MFLEPSWTIFVVDHRLSHQEPPIGPIFLVSHKDVFVVKHNPLLNTTAHQTGKEGTIIARVGYSYSFTSMVTFVVMTAGVILTAK